MLQSDTERREEFESICFTLHFFSPHSYEFDGKVYPSSGDESGDLP